jgi:hypothetical protein
LNRCVVLLLVITAAYFQNGTHARGQRTQFLTAWRSLYSRPPAGMLALATPGVPDCPAVKDHLEALAVRACAGYETTRRRP